MKIIFLCIFDAADQWSYFQCGWCFLAEEAHVCLSMRWAGNTENGRHGCRFLRFHQKLPDNPTATSEESSEFPDSDP